MQVMLKKNNRWRGRIAGDFFRRSQKKNLGYALLYFLPDEHLTVSKMTIIVPKKQVRLSVQRHLAKRKLSQVWQSKLKNLQSGYYALVVNRQWQQGLQDSG